MLVAEQLQATSPGCKTQNLRPNHQCLSVILKDVFVERRDAFFVYGCSRELGEMHCQAPIAV